MNTTELYRIIEQKERKIKSLKQENGNLLVKLRDEKQLRIGGVSQQRELLDRLDKIENWAYNNAKDEDLDFLNKIFRSNCG